MDDPPTKASLLRWWKAFKSRDSTKQQQPASSSARAKQPPPSHQQTPLLQQQHPAYIPPGRGLERGKDGRGRVFGVSLEESLQYASVAISMVGLDGKQYVYGYVPIVVAKCGMWLKENGIFRVSGSNKRINQLQAVFDEPPRYGKEFDWTGYSVHDAASVLRRYLNSLPDPVIPAGLYLDFTAVLQQPQPIDASIAAYRQLIALLPPASRYLLLYLLDFLSVFARCSSQNLMTASNLAVVFQPGLVSPRGAGLNALLGFPGFVEGKPPTNGSASPPPTAGAQEQAGEHGRGKEVLEFLIENQAAFMLDLEPPVDEEGQKTKGVHSAAPSPPLASPTRGTYPLTPPPEEVPAQVQVQQPVASTSAVPFDPTAERRGSGATDLARRGSEKSVERRRLRKSNDTKDGGKVKRSKTWGSSTARRRRGEGKEGSPSPAATPSSSNSPQPPSTAAFASPSAPPTSTSTPAGPQATVLPPPPPPPSSSIPAPRSPLLGRQPSKKARKSVDVPFVSSAPASSAVPAPAPAPVPTAAAEALPTALSSSTGSNASGGGGGDRRSGGGLLGFAKSKRRSLTPEAGR
ncbi:hypothetical protein JCM6882_009017 [Rhodosporidiobolus microsporus]